MPEASCNYQKKGKQLESPKQEKIRKMAEEREDENRSQHIAIEVEWVESIRKRFPPTSVSSLTSEQPTIHRVPISIRQADNRAYEPQLVSIGPYHHNKKRLKPMEVHKWRYLQAILSRNQTVTLEEYLKKMKELEPQARKYYSEPIKLDSKKFVEMMLLDGCFIVELFVKNCKKDDNDDPLYGSRSLLQSVSEDMLLLENQIPYCILQCIFNRVFLDERVDATLVRQAINFFDFVRFFNREISEERSFYTLLDLVHYHCSPSTPKQENPVKISYISIPCAKHLEESGIKFIKKKKSSSSLDVHFENGVLAIPYLLIDDTTNSLFRNFIALEQCCPNTGNYFTVYTTFMDLIVNTRADVEILCAKGILEHGLGSDKEVAILFNKMGKGVIVYLRDTYLSKLLKDVTDHCNTVWHRWRASLMRDYFSNPWTLLSLVGAIVLLVLTVIQTFYAAYAYARPP